MQACFNEIPLYFIMKVFTKALWIFSTVAVMASAKHERRNQKAFVLELKSLGIGDLKSAKDDLYENSLSTLDNLKRGSCNVFFLLYTFFFLNVLYGVFIEVAFGFLYCFHGGHVNFSWNETAKLDTEI